MTDLGDIAALELADTQRALAKAILGVELVKGEQGERGYDGDRGPVGPEGPKGDLGPQGPKGDKGDKGDQGEKGDLGPVGPKGVKGDRGRDGLAGKAADGLTWRGTFAYGTTYQPGDVVEWEGSSYVALTVTARRPPDPDWDLLAAKGEPGASGRGYIRGGGGSGGAGVTDHGALTGLADDDHPQYLTQAEADALYAATGDYIPQGGPLTASLDADVFELTGPVGGQVALRGVASGGTTGASIIAQAATVGGGFAGSAVLESGTGKVGVAGGPTTIIGGYGDDGNDAPAGILLNGGDGAGNAGLIQITTDNDTGSSGDLLTAQGDGTALWVPPAASGLTQAQVFARMTGA